MEIDKNLYEEKVSSREIFKGKILKLYFDQVRLPNNRITTREKVEHPGAVAVVPITNENEVILVKQYRYPVDTVLTEIPAGKLDGTEPPIECARRELKEEVGGHGGNFIHLAQIFTSPGFSDEKMDIYLVRDFEEKENSLDDDEFLHIIKIKLKDCLEMIKNGEISDAKSIIGIMMARDYLGIE
jgi:ADP-ribose pyrophosphatase